MRKLILLSVMAFAITQVKAQDFCADDVVTNLTADIQKTQMQVVMTWDFDTPITCTICPPFSVYYDVEVEYGYRAFGPTGAITWGQGASFVHVESDTEPVHEFTVPITFKFEYFRYRVRITNTPACTNWDGWVETSIWD